MSEWTVVTVIAVLSGLVISFVKPLVTLNNTLTRLTDEVEVLRQELRDLREEAASQSQRLQEHELRLTRMESR